MSEKPEARSVSEALPWQGSGGGWGAKAAFVMTSGMIWICSQLHPLAPWSLLLSPQLPSLGGLGTKLPVMYFVSAEGPGCELGPGRLHCRPQNGRTRIRHGNVASVIAQGRIGPPDRSIFLGHDPNPNQRRELFQNVCVGAGEQQALL